MRPLGLSDTILYNMRDGFIAAAAVLDRPCHVPTMVAQLHGLVASSPGWTERPLRLGVWSFARAPAPVDLRQHISIADDPTVRTTADVLALLERLRRNRLRTSAPPWRVILLNPEGSEGARAGALSASFMQMRHGLADAARGLQAMSRIRDFEAGPEDETYAKGLPTVDFAAFRQDVPMHDTGMLAFSIPRQEVARTGDASGHLAAVSNRLVHEADLFPGAPPFRGNYGRTRLLKRHGASSGVGNHIRMETISVGRPEEKKALVIPGLARAQNLPVTQWLVAVAPGVLARQMMRIWYDSFDAIATLLPMPPNLSVGAAGVTAMLGVPPLWGPVPVVLFAMVDRTHYHMTVFPGRGFAGDTAALETRIRAMLGEVV